MEFLPALRLGLLNGWLLLVAYFAGLATMVASFSREKRRKLFLEPSYPRGSLGWVIVTVGRIAAVSFVLLMFFTPLRLGTPCFYVGMVVYVAGFVVVMLSLLDYRRAPAEGLVTQGLYRISRNPQWVGLVLVFAGSTIAVAVWLHIVLVSTLVTAYHWQVLLEERICGDTYGEAYTAYRAEVPRYLLFD